MIHKISQDDLGICGFTSMVQLLIDHHKMTEREFYEDYGSSTAYANEWLQIQLDHDAKIKQSSNVATALSESLKFTGGFGDDYEVTIEELQETKKWDWKKRPGFALTAEAIADYLHRRYNLRIAFDLSVDGKDISLLNEKPLAPGIYGIRTNDVDYIQHWVYVDNAGNLMTWQRENAAAYDALIEEGFTKVITRILVK